MHTRDVYDIEMDNRIDNFTVMDKILGQFSTINIQFISFKMPRKQLRISIKVFILE